MFILNGFLVESVFLLLTMYIIVWYVTGGVLDFEKCLRHESLSVLRGASTIAAQRHGIGLPKDWTIPLNVEWTLS